MIAVEVSELVKGWVCFHKLSLLVAILFFEHHRVCSHKAIFVLRIEKLVQCPTHIFLVLGYDYFDAKYSDKINLWKPNTHGIKLQFHPKIYDYLLATLPEKQAKMLEQSYRNSSLGQRNKKRQR